MTTPDSRTAFSRTKVVLFFLLMWLPLLGMVPFISHHSTSIDEKRKLTKFPEFTWSEIDKWPEKFEAFYDDNFGFRPYFLLGNCLVRHKLLRAPGDGAFFGKDGWMFYSREGVVDQFRGLKRFSDAELNRFVRIFSERTEYFNANGVKFLYVAAPNKSTVYPEYVPDWIHRVDSGNLEQIEAYFDEKGDLFPFLDLRRSLIQEKKRAILYGKTDTHWNQLGAFFAYQSIVERLRLSFPELQGLTEDEFEFVNPPSASGGDLAGLFGAQAFFNEPFHYEAKLKHRSAITDTKVWLNGKRLDSDGIAVALPRYDSLVTTDRQDAPRVIFVRDSFSNALYPFLAQTFGQSYFTSDKSVLFSERIFERIQPDVVVVIWVERTLNWAWRADTFFKSRDRDGPIAE